MAQAGAYAFPNDQQFLTSVGVTPYSANDFQASDQHRRRTRFLMVFGILQAAAYVAGLIWTATW